MKLENFNLVKIDDHQIIEIEYLGNVFDLHNAAEFLGIEYVIKKSLLTLFWRYYFDDENSFLFQIKFDGTVYFEISPRDKEMPKDEDECLEEIIFCDYFEFKFMGGMKIAVQAERVFFEKMGL